MTYDNMGGIVQKNQNASLTYPGYPGEKYNYYYTQGNTSHPHATSKVWDRRNHKQYTYGFDNNGNPTTTHEQYAPPLQGQPNPSGPIDLIQENYWDEQNQLRGLWNLAGLHHYIYDADGQRLMKSSVPMSHGAVNAQSLQATNTIPSVEYTVYVSAGLVYESDGTSDSYTKHYYAGPLRVASQIGSGNPNYETHPTSGGNLAQGGPVSATAPTNGLAVLGDLNSLLANYGMSVSPTAPPTDTIAMQVVYHPTECDQFYAADHIERNRCLCDNFPDYALSKGIDCSPYTPIYWYHPDYIGNVEFVTDRTGQPYQHFYYAPFGDPMVSQHVGTGSFNSAFRFNAKEYDEETGNYYYGARYYEPKSSVWMGVDALATKYPGMNPYNFTMGNPIMAIDPDGNDTTMTGWFINLYKGTLEQYKNGVDDPYDKALVYLGPNDASVTDIYNALEEKGYEHGIVDGGHRVDTYIQYKMWVTQKVFDEGLPPIILMSFGTGGLSSSSRAFGPQLPARTIGQAAKGVLNVEQRSLQHMFSRHGKDFGVTGNWNKAMAGEFEGVLRSHMQGLTPIQGTYRGTQQALHYFNSSTGLNVMTDMSGNLLGGWKLSADQVKYLLSTGAVK
jgi:RHS repeat-associated protein